MATGLINRCRKTPLCFVLAAGLCGVCLPTQAADVALTRVTIDENPPAKPYYKMVGDINGDGRLDIVLTPAELKGQTYRIAWYEAPHDPKSPAWTEHVVVPSIECVIHSLGVADFDGDGDIDLAIAEMHQGDDPDEVSILLNQGAGTAWRKQVLSTHGAHDIVVADIDNDADPDIIGANHAGPYHPLELWRNNR